jgi:hypothetical protein
MMDSSHKKAFLLLKSIIFLYHDFTEEEILLLEHSATELDAKEELKWAMDFVNEDVYTAYDRTRDYLKIALQNEDPKNKVSYLFDVWSATNTKGYITEMEALAMIKLARDWDVESDFIKLVRKK